MECHILSRTKEKRATRNALANQLPGLDTLFHHTGKSPFFCPLCLSSEDIGP